MAAPVILLMGPPGSGKGTQAKLLAADLNGVHLSSGQIMREGHNQASKDYVAKGNFADTDYFVQVMGEALDKVPADSPIVFDGVGKMLPEAEWLDAELHTRGREVAWVILLDASREEVIKRTKLRRQEKARGDDSDEAMQSRLDLYDKETLPVLEYWNEQGLLVRVDGVGTVEEVADRIQEVLHEA